MLGKIINLYKRLFWSCEKYARSLGVVVGENCLISTKKFPSEAYLVKIGDGCRVAKGVSFFTHGGLWTQRQKLKENLDYFGRITVGDYTYLGEDCKIMPGVKIGNDVIVGAGTIVTKSIPDGKICAGNPGRIVGETKDFVDKIRLYDVNTKGMMPKQKQGFLLSLSDDKFVVK